MTMRDILNASGLTGQPFRIVPPNDMDGLIWAGDRNVLDRLTTAAASPHPESLQTSELVIVWGDYGSGKTHTLKFLASKLKESGQLVAYMPNMKVAENPRWNDILRNIFSSQFSRDDVVKRLGHLRQYVLNERRARAEAELGAEAAENPDKLVRLEAEKQNQIFGEVLPDCPGFVRFMMDLSDPNNVSAMDTNWRFLSTKMTNTQAANVATPYGMPPSGMSTDHDAGLLFSYFCRVMTYKTPNGIGTPVIHILMDEAEDLNSLPVASTGSIAQGIRTMVDSTTEHAFFAFAATVSDAAELYGIFDQPIMQRLSRTPFVVQQLTPESAKQFLIDEISQHRTPDFNGPPEWPFSPEGIEAFVNNMPPPITLRRLNVSAQRILFDEYGAKIVRGEAGDAADVIDFTSWGGG